jgi:hypothetical protein
VRLEERIEPAPWVAGTLNRLALAAAGTALPGKSEKLLRTMLVPVLAGALSERSPRRHATVAGASRDRRILNVNGASKPIEQALDDALRSSS